MGGQAAIGLAVEHTERISHLITMGASAQGTNVFSPGGLSEGIKVLVETYKRPTVENFQRLIRVMVYDPSFATQQLLEDRVKAALSREIHLSNWLVPVEKGMAVNLGYSPPDVMPRLAGVMVPALIMHGRDDRTVPLENSLRLLAALPNATSVIFNRCGHWAQVEHADQFDWLVDSFISHSGA
jgi:2-hydroxy-6-oxonona-2,4-dienedioate hydrolase